MKRLIPAFGVVLIGTGILFSFFGYYTPSVDEPKTGSETDQVMATTREGEAVQSPYKEFQVYFGSWELPTAGLLPAEAPVYEEENRENIAIYKNGYRFDKELKRMTDPAYTDDGSLKEPTPEQLTGVVKGYLSKTTSTDRVTDAAIRGRTEDYVVKLDELIEKLDRAHQFNEYELLTVWLEETKALLVKARDSKDGGKRWNAWNKAYDRLKKMDQVL